MTVTIESFIVAFAFLCLGVFVFATVNRLIYPRLRWRYEKAKLTQRQGINPTVLLGLTKLIGFIVLPVFGFYLGSAA